MQYRELNESLWGQTLDYNFDGIVSGVTMDLIDFNNFKINRGVTSMRMMEQKTQFLPVSFMVDSGKIVFHEYNEIIRRLRDAGITEYWKNYYIRNEKVDEFGPEILTLSQLEIGFCACMIPLALSIVAVLFELYSELIMYALGKLKKTILKLLRGF